MAIWSEFRLEINNKRDYADVPGFNFMFTRLE